MQTYRPNAIPIQRTLTVLVIVCALIIGGLYLVPSARAESSTTDLVPEPSVNETHEYSVPIDSSTIGNEVWKLSITQGDETILLFARNMTSNTGTFVDYQLDINYKIGDTLYIAQFTIMQLTFVIGDQRIQPSLSSCHDIEMTYTPMKYNGTVPSMYCNITFSGIDVYPGVAFDSTFNLTLSHLITADWNQTDINVEALLDLNNTRLMNPMMNEEIPAGTSYAIEIPYSMMLTLPNSSGQAIIPSGHSSTSMDYNLTFENGNPLTVSKLTMNNGFSLYNVTGCHNSEGYSSMQYGSRSLVTYGFSNLTYKDTESVKSDPEVTIYHDSVADTMAANGNLGLSNIMIYIMVIGVIGTVGGATFIVFRKKNKRENGGK